MKATFPKCPPKVITYRDIRNFIKVAFKKDLKEQLNSIHMNTYIDFEIALT